MTDRDIDAKFDRQPHLVIAAAALGVLLGWAGALPLSILAVGNLVVWGLAAAALGMIDGTDPATALRLGVFGFTLGFAFMCFDYTGDSPLATRVVPFAIIGVFCAGCAIAMGLAARLLRIYWRRHAKSE
jgi:hypothetical protein